MQLEGELEKYLVKRAEAAQLVTALRAELDTARAQYAEKLPMIELLKVRVLSRPLSVPCLGPYLIELLKVRVLSRPLSMSYLGPYLIELLKVRDAGPCQCPI